VEAIVALPRDRAKLRRDALEMRELLEKEKPPRDIWDLKLIPGGIIDLEFIAQVAALSGALEGRTRPTDTGEALAALSPAFADAQVREELTEAHRLYIVLTQIVRLCLTGPLDPDDVPPGLADILMRRVDLPDFGVLEAHLKDTAKRVRGHFDRLLKKG
jgi:[glutamine synthetase] adenylyltransferase / [glutamine synthetase]-adenylyl-L-tyrosine phosphorylase